MAEHGTPVETLDVLLKYTMSEDVARTLKNRFIEISSEGGGVSYMDCVLFDAALGVLGEEQAYYGLDDDEWKDTLKAREKLEKRFKTVKVIDVTDTWREVLDSRQVAEHRHEATST